MPMPKATLSPEARAAVVAHANEFGPSSAADAFDIDVPIIKVWQSRARKAALLNPSASVISPATGPVTNDANVQGNETLLPSVTSAHQIVGGSPTSAKGKVARPRMRKAESQTDKFLAAARDEAWSMLRLIKRARGDTTTSLIERAKVCVAGFEKLLRAGRDCFGYGIPEGMQGARALINVNVHNGHRGDDLPPAIDVETSEPTVSTEIEPPRSVDAQSVDAEDAQSQQADATE